MTPITLVCWTCNAATHGEVEALPSLGVELVNIAQQAGLTAVIDYDRGRVLIFCNEPCMRRALTKSGRWRVRPPKAVA